MFVRTAIPILSLLVPASALAQPAEPAQEEATTSYRHQTLAVDGIGLALLVAGGLSEGENGRDTDASNALFTVGGLTMLLGAPIIHGARGHTGRAAGSFLMRAGLASGGMVVAIAMNSRCGDGHAAEEGALFGDDFLCELDYIGYGMLGGLVVASVIDAAFMTDEAIEPGSQWAPQVAATSDGVRVGAAFAW